MNKVILEPETGRCSYCDQELTLIVERDGEKYCSLSCLERKIWRSGEDDGGSQLD